MKISFLINNDNKKTVNVFKRVKIFKTVNVYLQGQAKISITVQSMRDNSGYVFSVVECVYKFH